MNDARRRGFLVAAGLALHSPTALAQQEKRVRRIGYLGLASPQSTASWLAAFREGMAALRWVEGRDYVIEERYANGVAQAGPGLAAELVATRPDLLLTPGNQGVDLFAKATRTIPIVFAIVQDPLGNGFAASLRRPGGNATGLTSLGFDLSAKRLQLLKEAFPRVAHVVLLFDAVDVASVALVKENQEAAARLKIRVTPIGLRQPTDIDAAFKRGAALGADAFAVVQGFFFVNQRQAIADRSLDSRLPTIFYDNQHVEAGGLMSYSASNADNFRRAAAYVDKILKGAKPGDLAIEQPVKFELVLNLKTARSMGFTFPQTILLQADRVIE
jgi:putative ABC transport system substrate-binding protein